MGNTASAMLGPMYVAETLFWGVLVALLVWGAKLLWGKVRDRLPEQDDPEEEVEVITAESIGQAIQENRKRIGLTQDKLGKKLNVSRQTISKWENNTVAPAPLHLCALAAVFGISADQLVPEQYLERK